MELASLHVLSPSGRETRTARACCCRAAGCVALRTPLRSTLHSAALVTFCGLVGCAGGSVAATCSSRLAYAKGGLFCGLT